MTSAPPKSDKTSKPPIEHEILFQNWFKSVGPRTYAAQLKKARNGNHFLVLTEGNRHKETGDIRKTRIFIYSEDFAAFFRMLHEAAVFIRENPVPDDVKRRQEQFWAKEKSSKGQPASGRVPTNKPTESGNATRPGQSRGNNEHWQQDRPNGGNERGAGRRTTPPRTRSRPAPLQPA